MLASASRAFQFVIGVDIHDENDKVQAALRERGVRNAQLMKTEGARLPVGSGQIDCVYSFIVLQHVETYAVFKRYFEETFRVLKPGGLAVLYFARRYRWSFNRSSGLLYTLDRLVEPLLIRQGYEELPASVNSTNLRVSLRQGKSLARSDWLRRDAHAGFTPESAGWNGSVWRPTRTGSEETELRNHV